MAEDPTAPYRPLQTAAVAEMAVVSNFWNVCFQVYRSVNFVTFSSTTTAS